MQTIQTLRKQGYKVKVMHFRNRKIIQRISGPEEVIDALGGRTLIQLTNPEKTITVCGEAICSLEDGFNHRIGNQIALGRAFKLMEEEKQKNQNTTNE